MVKQKRRLSATIFTKKKIEVFSTEIEEVQDS